MCLHVCMRLHFCEAVLGFVCEYGLVFPFVPSPYAGVCMFVCAYMFACALYVPSSWQAVLYGQMFALSILQMLLHVYHYGINTCYCTIFKMPLTTTEIKTCAAFRRFPKIVRNIEYG